MAEIIFTPSAYCKIILHCAKYPHCAVNGVLLAESSSKKDVKNENKLVFVDAIPLFHICLQVSPMYEIALMKIDELATSRGLVIAGYYLANENYRDISSDIGRRVADKIAENFPSACLVVVDNKKLALCHAEAPLIVSQSSDGKWKSKEKSIVSVSEEAFESISTLLKQQRESMLFDFDNYLDDISIDWKNSAIDSLIESN